MSDAAQAAYITAQAKYAKTGAQLKEATNAPFAKPPRGASGQPITDRVQRILVATITRPNDDYRPGDRIMRAVVSIRPLNFSFGNYTVAQTDRKTLDITSLTRSTTQTGSLSISAPAGAPVGGTASAGITHAVGTTTPLHDAEEVLTINPTPGCLTITREGGYGIDLTGDTLISLATMATEPGHEDACGVRAPTKLIRIQDSGRQRIFIVDPNLTFGGRGPAISGKAVPGVIRIYPEHPFAAQVTMDFVLRRIDRGADSYEEGTQAVSLVSGHKTFCEVVLPADELTPSLFGIVNSIGDYVDIMVDGRETVFAFSDPEAARSAAQWMTKTHATHLGSLPLTSTQPATFLSGPIPPKAGGSVCDQQSAAKP